MKNTIKLFTSSQNTKKVEAIIGIFLLIYTILFSSLFYQTFPSFFIIGILISVVSAIGFGTFFYFYLHPVFRIDEDGLFFRHYFFVRINKSMIDTFSIEVIDGKEMLLVFPKDHTSAKEIISIPATLFDLQEIEYHLTEYTK